MGEGERDHKAAPPPPGCSLLLFGGLLSHLLHHPRRIPRKCLSPGWGGSILLLAGLSEERPFSFLLAGGGLATELLLEAERGPPYYIWESLFAPVLLEV